MRILVVTRFDAQKKPGGDVNLLTELGELLLMGSEKEFTVEYHVGVPSKIVVRNFDAVLAANIDRPVEAYLTLKLCLECEVKFYLYTLHHPQCGIESYLKIGTFGIKKIIAFISSYKADIYEDVLWFVKVIKSYISGPRLIFRSSKKCQKYLLELSSGILVVSKGELKTINDDLFEVKSPIYEVPHPISRIKTSTLKKTKEKNKIVCPGRIEARKNQKFMLEVAKVCPDLEFTFIGGASPSEPDYYVDFEKKVKGLNNVNHISSLPKDDFYEELSSYQTVFTASWFEVTSLIELYSLSNGIKLVSSGMSYNSSFFSSELNYKLGDIFSAKEILTSAVCTDTDTDTDYPTNEEISLYLVRDVFKGGD
ncbi:glycosyltransferase [Vibrio cyclitrophicus]|uniref:glycosyltransferase n=1 Tax=Vibrio cyclitrophicus TaxID=47951 RepID=UPI000C853031|nr:glycosyltransferase [Vibrio cyclitrophicus]PMJ76502.1 hypothetical protein BCU15_02490 [Vibrio cyclitrophicus]